MVVPATGSVCGSSKQRWKKEGRLVRNEALRSVDTIGRRSIRLIVAVRSATAHDASMRPLSEVLAGRSAEQDAATDGRRTDTGRTAESPLRHCPKQETKHLPSCWCFFSKVQRCTLDKETAENEQGEDHGAWVEVREGRERGGHLAHHEDAVSSTRTAKFRGSDWLPSRRSVPDGVNSGGKTGGRISTLQPPRTKIAFLNLEIRCKCELRIVQKNTIDIVNKTRRKSHGRATKFFGSPDRGSDRVRKRGGAKRPDVGGGSVVVVSIEPEKSNERHRMSESTTLLYSILYSATLLSLPSIHHSSPLFSILSLALQFDQSVERAVCDKSCDTVYAPSITQ